MNGFDANDFRIEVIQTSRANWNYYNYNHFASYQFHAWMNAFWHASPVRRDQSHTELFIAMQLLQFDAVQYVINDM